MKRLIFLFAICILSGCSKSINELEDLPQIDFDLQPVMSSPSIQSKKVTFKYINAGTDFFLIINNGRKEFLILDAFSIAGSKCAYAARTKINVAPVSVATYKLPTIGLIGLCYSNNDQLFFIENGFKNISEKGGDIKLPLYSMIKYHFPGNAAEAESKTVNNLYVNFERLGSSNAPSAIKAD